jgi:hypothetical protein
VVRGLNQVVVVGLDPAACPSGAYNLDKLFRSNSSGSSPGVNGQGPRSTDARGEVMHIAANTAMTGAVGDEDRAYLANLVATKTGVSTDEAQKRVDAFIQAVKDASGQAKSAAERGPKVRSHPRLFIPRWHF